MGVGRLPDGRVVFVPRTAPGDLLEAEPVRSGKRWLRARPVRILESGPGRVEPPCPLFARCGGCQLQHLSGEVQVEAKELIIVDALTRIGGLGALPRIEMHPAPAPLHYRSRVAFTLRRPGRHGVVAGFHEEDRPGRILDVDDCCLLPEPVLLRGWRGLRRSWGKGARRLPPGRELRLTLRAVSEAEFVLMVEGGDGPSGGETTEQGGCRLVRDVPGLAAIWHRPGRGEGWTLIAGEGALGEVRQGETVPVRPGAFVQVNRAGSELLHGLTLGEVGEVEGARVVDAYCGVGFYGRRLAAGGARVTGIELDPEAVGIARSLATSPTGDARVAWGGAPDGLAAIPRSGSFELLEGRVEERLSEALPADLVLLNPPRGGVAGGVMEALAGARPSKIIYVSCDPATLARDLARLGAGYHVARVQGVDLFPQTAHVETVVTLNAEQEG